MRAASVYQIKIVKGMTGVFIISCILSCTPAPEKQQKPIKKPSVKIQPTAKKQGDAKKSIVDGPVQRADMKFVAYNDDGDYYLLSARKGDSTYDFINNIDDRSLNKGDLISITWKRGTIYIAGEGETPAQADLITSVKKTGDGAVSKFRITYAKKLKYTWAPEENYSQSYLDKLYLQVEYYLATTENELLQLHLGKNDELTYSIEQQEKSNRMYTVIGIAAESEHHSSIIQWLYLDVERDQLYEYDLPNNKLLIFN
jgi:hypothetical protein